MLRVITAPRLGIRVVRVPNQLIETHRNVSAREINMEATKKEGMLQMERSRGKTLEDIRRSTRSSQCWWEAPMEELIIFQLQQMMEALEWKKKICEREAQHQQMVHCIEFPFRTLGSALVPRGDRESSSYGSYARQSNNSMASSFPF